MAYPVRDEIVRHRLLRTGFYLMLLFPASYLCQQLVGYEAQKNELLVDPDASLGWLFSMIAAVLLGTSPRRLRPWLGLGTLAMLTCHTLMLVTGCPIGHAGGIALMAVVMLPAGIAQHYYEQCGLSDNDDANA